MNTCSYIFYAAIDMNKRLRIASVIFHQQFQILLFLALNYIHCKLFHVLHRIVQNFKPHCCGFNLIFRSQSSKKARSYGLCGLFIFFIVTIWSAWMESNHRTWRLRPMLYPLSYRHITLKLYQILLKFASVYVIIIMKFYWMNNFFKI